MYVPGEPGKPGVLVFSRNATHAEIIEELKHLKQHQALGYKALSASEMIEMEVRAHEDMLVYAKREGWN